MVRLSLLRVFRLLLILIATTVVLSVTDIFSPRLLFLFRSTPSAAPLGSTGKLVRRETVPVSSPRSRNVSTFRPNSTTLGQKHNDSRPHIIGPYRGLSDSKDGADLQQTFTRKSTSKDSSPIRALGDDGNSIFKYAQKLMWALGDALAGGELLLQLNRTDTNKALYDIVASLRETGDEFYLSEMTSYFTKRATVVNDFLPQLTIQARKLCSTKDLFLLIAIPSVAGHFETREAIRATWASPLYGAQWPRGKAIRHSVKLVFFFGTGASLNDTNKLRRESEIYEDIVQADFNDSYRNLSLKMASVLHWSSTYCSSARHILKVDEDTFVNLPLLLDVLEVVSAKANYFVMGRRVGNALKGTPVWRTQKWAVSRDVYPLSVYPIYFFGHSYVISGDAVSDLLDAYQHMPLLMVEDAFFTGILAKTVGVRRIGSPHFAGVSDYASSGKIHRCKLFVDQSVTQTSFKSPSSLYRMWTLVETAKCPYTKKRPHK